MILHVMNEGPERDCGACTACCDVIGVSELGKPYYARCEHLGDNCNIYHARPDACRKYRCAWHRGLLGDSIDRRPDRCGLLFDLDQSSEGASLTISVYEFTSGALATARHRFLVEKLRSHKKLRNARFDKVNLYPYGSQIHLSYAVSECYDWTAPAGGTIRFETTARQDQGTFAGELAPLALPKR